MRTENFTIQKIDLVPALSSMFPGILYYDKQSGLSFHKCACGCGDIIILEHNYKWNIDENTITISPSIGRMTAPCKSHYFIRNGKVVWC